MRSLKSSLSPHFGSASDLQPPKKYLSVFACFCSEACKSLKLWYLVLPRWTNLLCLLVLAVSSAELSLYWTMCQFNMWITPRFCHLCSSGLVQVKYFHAQMFLLCFVLGFFLKHWSSECVSMKNARFRILSDQNRASFICRNKLDMTK